MKEYEISNDDKYIGKIKVFNEVNNTYIIETKDKCLYDVIKENELQTYIISINVNNDDELYDKVSIYKKDNIFEEIEKIKKNNNIKHIKKDTVLDIIVPSTYLKKYNKNINNIDILSLFFSKIEFIKKSINNLNDKDLKIKMNGIITNYNNYKNSNEYDFLTDEEKEDNIKKYNKELDIIIKKIENNTSFKFGKNFITPIRILN